MRLSTRYLFANTPADGFATMDRMDPAAIAALTLAERLRAMEMLWDSLSREDAPELSPDWHAPLLRQRRLDLATSPTSSLEDADARLRRLFGFD